MKFRIVSITQKQDWNEIVTGFVNYSVHYLNEYSAAFQSEMEGVPYLFYYNDEITRAIKIFVKKDISKVRNFNLFIESNTWFDITTPYGYGGFIFEGDGYQNVIFEFNKFCIENNIVSEFVRFSLFHDKNVNYPYKKIKKMNNIVRNLELPLNEIFMDFKPGFRKNLRRSMENSLEISIDVTGDRFEEFYSIYNNTMERTYAHKMYFFSRNFFEEINSMKNNIIYFHVLYEGNVISTELVLYDSKNCYSFLGGTNHNFFKLHPNQFLKFEIIKWAKEKGLVNFVLGGGKSDDGIFIYKRGISPKGVKDFYVGENIINSLMYEKLVVYNNCKTNSLSFFPEYRNI